MNYFHDFGFVLPVCVVYTGTVHRLRSPCETFDGNEICLAHELIRILNDKPIKHL